MFHTGLLDRLRTSRENLTSAVKDYLKGCEENLREVHLGGETGTAVCRAYTLVIDDLLKTLFEIKTAEKRPKEPTALVAIGGYGRGELNIRSDIDLMLLHRNRVTPEVEDLTQGILYILWDTGLDLGFSIRTVEECLRLAKDDLKTMTSLLDLRFLHGERAIYENLEAGIRKKLFNRRRLNSFIKEKLDESAQRHEKFGGSVYTLEPNVKEGEGGLRDLHTARWIIKAQNGEPVEPFSLGLISEKDKTTLQGSLDFLLWVRNDLHFATSRKSDQLTFDHQERIARLLAFETTERALAVENFMRDYYTHAVNISHYSNLMLSRWLHRDRAKAFGWPKKRVRIDKDYFISGGMLRCRDEEKAITDPVTAMKAFEYSQSFGVEIDRAAEDMVLAFLEAHTGDLTVSKEANRVFLKILKGKNVHKTLAEMHRLRVLERFIPEFEGVRCRTQHDLYHIYTVDVHTLFAVRELERLRDRYKFDYPLLSTLYEELPNQEVLVLSVLLHDIGKAFGKGHSEKGARVAPGICGRLGLSEDDSSTAEFLVRNHLILADTAQYRDLHDERLIVEFAKRVGEIERLSLLYLLTFADVRAVGPDVWNQWKGTLFQELYFKALTVLERGVFEIEEAEPRVRRIQKRVTELLTPEGITKDAVGEFFKLLPQRYFLSNPPELIAGHLKTLKGFSGERPHAMDVRQDTAREYTEVVICTHDAHGLFSMIAGVMAANGVNILGAQINTLKNGIALDILQVNSPHEGLVKDEYKIKKIDSDLADVITGKVAVEKLVGRRKPSILDKKARPRVPTRILVDNDVSDSYTVIDIKTQNRIGLLYDITRTLTGLGLYIHISKISTKGDEAADIFYTRDIFGQKIYYKERLREIVETLDGVLAEGGNGMEGGE
ncbi:MAG TPA: [protein-PII] uridylyltransferase, partial [Thermodesulfobacteriota bacterium]|nr:[protein-PII] uridylyltransferase [Thermodesulfobacteriota bacterium]